MKGKHRNQPFLCLREMFEGNCLGENNRELDRDCMHDTTLTTSPSDIGRISAASRSHVLKPLAVYRRSCLVG